MLPDRRKRLIVVAGPPCSGKSCLAEILAKHTGIRHLEMDAIRARLMPESRHAKPDRDIAYRTMHLAAEMLLGAGHSVILDATYMPVEHRLELEGIAEFTGSPIFIIECRVSPETAIVRFGMRAQHAAVDLTPSRVHWLSAHYPFYGKGFIHNSDLQREPDLAGIRAYLIEGTPVPDCKWSESACGAVEPCIEGASEPWPAQPVGASLETGHR